MENPTNCFEEVIVRVDMPSFSIEQQDLWSKTCIEQFELRPQEEYGYCFGQVFERHVLEEVALLRGKNLSNLEALNDESSEALNVLRTMLAERHRFSPVGRINLASALVSISRFELAERVLAEAKAGPLNNRDRFELASLYFVISNREADIARMQSSYHVIRACIEAGGIPGNRILSAASSAVVWHMKLKFLTKEDFRWFEALGAVLAEKPDSLDQGALSGWYRGVAMVPAAVGNQDLTRDYMQAAADAAHKAMEQRPTHYEMNLIKTYYESSVKEHMYVTRDVDAACEASRALIDLDPIWSVSRGEFAECLAFFKRFQDAATVFEEAAALGPPYFGHHLFSAAQIHEKLGNLDLAMTYYEKLLDLDPTQASVIVAGMRLSRQMDKHVQKQFEVALEGLPKLSDAHAKYLQDAA